MELFFLLFFLLIYILHFYDNSLYNSLYSSLSVYLSYHAQDLKGQDSEQELPWDIENAQQLVENSSEFDNWLNEVVFDLENFRSEKSEESTKTSETIPSE